LIQIAYRHIAHFWGSLRFPVGFGGLLRYTTG
jgi:hypothetical protein